MSDDDVMYSQYSHEMGQTFTEHVSHQHWKCVVKLNPMSECHSVAILPC